MLSWVRVIVRRNAIGAVLRKLMQDLIILQTHWNLLDRIIWWWNYTNWFKFNTEPYLSNQNDFVPYKFSPYMAVWPYVELLKCPLKKRGPSFTALLINLQIIVSGWNLKANITLRVQIPRTTTDECFHYIHYQAKCWLNVELGLIFRFYICSGPHTWVAYCHRRLS